MKLSIITANTNEWHVLRPCLQSVYRQTTDLEFEFIVIDNASTDGSFDRIREEFPDVKVIVNPHNMGFAASNNRGLATATGDYILFLNPDTEIREHAISGIVRFMDRNPDVGLAGCKLILGDGSIQESLGSFPSVWNVFAETFFLYKIFPKTKLFGSYHMTYFDYRSTREVDWLCGAFLIVRRAVRDTIGLLDEQFYMYTEEVDYCCRAKQAGYATWYFHEAEVIHYWGGINMSQRVVLWMHGSQMIYFKKHFRGFKKAALVALKYTTLLLRTVVYFIGGSLSLNSALIKKGWYYAVAVGKLFAQSWEYDHGHSGPVEPWRV
jgi:GT2 family glycosyltransferase